jgi:large subunit ribosomal protein L30
VKIKLVKSTIGYKRDQAATVKALGLHKLGQSRELPESPTINGMVRKVIHLLEVTK